MPKIKTLQPKDRKQKNQNLSNIKVAPSKSIGDIIDDLLDEYGRDWLPPPEPGTPEFSAYVKKQKKELTYFA